MAFFARLDSNNKVIKVYSVADHKAPTEEAGIEYISGLNDNHPFWKQAFRDGTRKNYPMKDSTYDEDKDAFILRKPFPSWVLNEDTCRWEPPVSRPNDGCYDWNEETTSWDLVT